MKINEFVFISARQCGKNYSRALAAEMVTKQVTEIEPLLCQQNNFTLLCLHEAEANQNKPRQNLFNAIELELKNENRTRHKRP
jgi:hypothetical protein